MVLLTFSYLEHLNDASNEISLFMKICHLCLIILCKRFGEQESKKNVVDANKIKRRIVERYENRDPHTSHARATHTGLQDVARSEACP